MVMEADVIVFDSLANLGDTEWVLDFLASKTDSFEKPKSFVWMSSVMTWAKTKTEEEESLTEDEYRKRRPHPNFKPHAQLEKSVVKYSKKEKFRGWVVAPGLLYHSGDSVFHHWIKVYIFDVECMA